MQKQPGGKPQKLVANVLNDMQQLEDGEWHDKSPILLHYIPLTCRIRKMVLFVLFVSGE